MNPARPGQQRERIFVGVRLRPQSEKERHANDTPVWIAADAKTLEYVGTKDLTAEATPSRNGSRKRRRMQHVWTFDTVIGPGTEERNVYEYTSKRLVQAAVSGMNGTVFAYGQTGSGKTHTMRSIAALAAADVFGHIRASPGREFTLHVSAMEIYNEEVRDMLSSRPEPLRLLDDPHRGTFAESATEVGVCSERHLSDVLATVEKRRHVRDTVANHNSSRSHQIVQLRIESKPVTESVRDSANGGGDADSGGETGEEGKRQRNNVMVAILNFVDLAGSERASTALMGDEQDGIRMREGIHINRSLLTLGSVMRELSSGARGGHVPYRNSKLTRLLQPALGGNALAAVVCTVSPCESSSINTRATLRFAAAAKRVTTAPRINLVQDSHTLIRGLHSEISALRAQLAQRQDLRSSRDSAQALRLEMRLQEEQFALQLAQKDRDLRRLRNLERLILRGPPGSARRGRAKGGGQEPAEDVARAAFASAPVSPAASGSPLRESGDACCTAVSAGADGLKSPCGQPWPTPGLAWHSGGSGARHAWQRRTQDYGGRTPGGLKSVNLRDVLLSPIIRRRVQRMRAGSDSPQSPPSGGRDRGPMAEGEGEDLMESQSSLSVKELHVDGLLEENSDSDEDPNRVEKDAMAAIANLTSKLAMLSVPSPPRAPSAPPSHNMRETGSHPAREAVAEKSPQSGWQSRARHATSPLAEQPAASCASSAMSCTVEGMGTPLSYTAATPNIGGVFASVHGSKRAPSPTPFNKGGIFGPLTRPQRTVSMPADRQQRGLGDMRHSKDVFTVGALGDNGDEDGKENIEPDGCAPPQPAVDASGVLQEITCSMQNRVSVASDDVFARAKSPHAGALMSPKSPGALSNDDRPETGSAISAQGDELVLAKTQRPAAHEVWAYAHGWYQQQLVHVQSDLRASIETDLANIKLCIASYQEQIARLTCQKRLLLEQVLKADAKVAEEKGVARSLAKELRKATAQAESLQHQLGEARAAAAHANQTAVEAVARAREAEGQRQKRGQHAGSAPLPEQSPWGEQDQAGLYEDETWAAVPQEENILPRIMRLWEDLHVPLIHRSRFVLAFRGKETFYFEAEHRRLEWIKSQLEAGAASSRPGLEREVERAARDLAEERAWLAEKMGGLLPRGPQRENLYKEFDIPLDAKRRKYAFARRLWTRKATQSYKSLWRHCELVLQLYGEEPGDRLHQAAFEAARTKAGKRSVFKRFVSRATGATQRSGA